MRKRLELTVGSNAKARVPFRRPSSNDKYHEAEFARYDLGIYLPKLYRDQSDLVIVVLAQLRRKAMDRLGTGSNPRSAEQPQG